MKRKDKGNVTKDCSFRGENCMGYKKKRLEVFRYYFKRYLL